MKNFFVTTFCLLGTFLTHEASSRIVKEKAEILDLKNNLQTTDGARAKDVKNPGMTPESVPRMDWGAGKAEEKTEEREMAAKKMLEETKKIIEGNNHIMNNVFKENGETEEEETIRKERNKFRTGENNFTMERMEKERDENLDKIMNKIDLQVKEEAERNEKERIKRQNEMNAEMLAIDSSLAKINEKHDTYKANRQTMTEKIDAQKDVQNYKKNFDFEGKKQTKTTLDDPTQNMKNSENYITTVNENNYTMAKNGDGEKERNEPSSRLEDLKLNNKKKDASVKLIEIKKNLGELNSEILIADFNFKSVLASKRSGVREDQKLELAQKALEKSKTSLNEMQKKLKEALDDLMKNSVNYITTVNENNYTMAKNGGGEKERNEPSSRLEDLKLNNKKKDASVKLIEIKKNLGELSSEILIADFNFKSVLASKRSGVREDQKLELAQKALEKSTISLNEMQKKLKEALDLFSN